MANLWRISRIKPKRKQLRITSGGNPKIRLHFFQSGLDSRKQYYIDEV